MGFITQLRQLPGGALSLALAAALFAVFPLIRPFFALDPRSSEALTAASAAITSPAWLLAHLLLTLAFVLLALGLLGLYRKLPGEQGGGGRPLRALVQSLAGIGLILPMVGVETFALPPIGHAHAAGASSVSQVFSRIYMGPGTITLFVGLVLLALGAIDFARSAKSWPAGLLAVGLALWCPLLPKEIRIADGLVIGIAGLWLAWRMWWAPAGLSGRGAEPATSAAA